MKTFLLRTRHTKKKVINNAQNKEMLDNIVYLLSTSSVRNLAIAAFLIRIVFIVYSVAHDSLFALPYTDVDYMVVSDGARHMFEGRSPFDRETYRYTPLLALVFLPNAVLGAWWGKVVLALCDVVAGYFVIKALTSAKTERQQQQAKLLVSTFIWFNPVVINVSTRGNSDIIIAMLTLGCVAAFSQQRYWVAGLFLGFAVHMKIYPIIYAAAFVFALLEESMAAKGGDKNSSSKSAPRTSLLAAIFASETQFVLKVFKAAAATALAAALPTAACYAAYGQRFLDDAILYHVGRIDHRHNLSPYWLQMYLGLFEQQHTASGTSQLTSSLFAFIPQMLMLVVVAWVLRKNAAHAVALETMLFVAFNKVCTVQYFVWYLPFVPFVLYSASDHPGSYGGLKIGIALWAIALGLWMLNGKRLEFDGEDTFVPLWACSIFFFIAQVFLSILMLRIALRRQKEKRD